MIIHMLDIRLIRENPEIIKKSLIKRNEEEKISWVEDLVTKDSEWRKLKQESDNLKQKRNKITQEIEQLKKNNKDISAKIMEAKEIPQQIKTADAKILELQKKIRFYLLRLPNILDVSVPKGKDDSQNKTIRKHGKTKSLKFDLKPHGELLQAAGYADFQRGAKVAGAGFYYLYEEFAQLDNALVQFAIDKLLKKKYKLISPPLFLNKKAYEGVASLEDFTNVMYKIENEELFLIATSEHSICAMLGNEILDENDLPMKFISVTPCFRREIGKHGIDTRGLFRVHQFNKVEQFIFSKPEQSKKLHEELIKNTEEIFKSLKLPYRVTNVCSGDMGLVASKKYDLDVWMPREKTYRELVSCSNCTSYQAVRSNIKYRKTKSQEKEYVHTLNSTAIATSRTIRAIIENHTNKSLKLKIPKPLLPYMNRIKEINLQP